MRHPQCAAGPAGGGTPGSGRVSGGDSCGVYSSGSVREELQLLSHGGPHSKGRLRPPPLGAGREAETEPAGPRPPAAASGADRPGVGPSLSGGRKSAGQSENLATGSTSQAASVANVSTAVEEIYQQISDTASQVSEVRGASEAMRRNAGDGDAQVQAMLTAISDIESSVHSIESAINIIQSLAFQTNILALNAAVEAARAGSSGKGFAVVADEVRSLAGNSSEAAQQIIGVLSGCREAVSRGSAVAAETSAVMGRIRESVEQVADQAVRISDRTAAQLEAVNGIKEDLGRVSDIVQSNAAASQECSAMVRELSEQARMLDQLSKT